MPSRGLAARGRLQDNRQTRAWTQGMMMQRRVFIAGAIAALTQAGAALASGYQDDVVAQLRSQGFGQIKIVTTWLGRTRITAQKGKLSREIIFNPRTGEILRDLVQNGDEVVTSRIGDSGGDDGSSRSEGDGGDDGSGSSDGSDSGSDGSGSSGSGSSGSGSSGSGSSGSGSGSSDSDSGDDGGKDEHDDGDD